jgi:hypothetical protein
MITYLNSKSYTVADLKAIADRMGIKVPAGSRKAEIAEVIVKGIDIVHDDYLFCQAEADRMADMVMEAFPPSIAEIDEDYRNSLSEARQAEIKMIDKEYYARHRAERQINNYIRFNNTDKLTPAQWRRVRKSLRKANLALRDLSVEFV